MSRTSTGSGWWLLLRWSARDLRARWLQVAAIALVIALGTGSFAGLSMVTRWRRLSADAGFERLAMYDLRVRLAEGSTVPRGQLAAAAGGLTGVASAEERLVVDVQVDASTPSRAILVPGTIYGVPVGNGAPHVNGFAIEKGRALDEGDRGQPRVLLEHHFAKFYGLAGEGTLRLGGGTQLGYVGQALTPEYFIVTTERGGLMAEANFAALFTSLETAQQVTGRGDTVNDLVLTLAKGTDRDGAARQLEELLAQRLPGAGATVMTRGEDPATRLNDADIKGDQQVYDIFAFLLFAGAVVAAFNLVTRIVEAQRREIGIAMTFGIRPLRIAVRPLLVAAEIALLGVIFGVAVGMLIGLAMASTLRSLEPLPEWKTPFIPRVFFGVCLAGFLLPFVATTWPVLRAVSVPPVAAIRAGYRTARGGGLAPLLTRLPLPGGTFARIPFRNVVRTPRRTLFTIVGIAAALAALVAFVGLIDSFLDTISRNDHEMRSRSPDRLDVVLDRPYPSGGPQLAAITGSPAVGRAEAGLRLSSTVIHGGEEVSVQLELLPLDSPIWTPALVDGRLDRQTPGVYLARLAADNLGVGVGDTVVLRHPVLGADGNFALVDTELPVLGLHPQPFRFVAYMDANHARLFQLAGAANLVHVLPAQGKSADDVKRALFELPGVTSAQGVSETANAIDDLLQQFVVALRVVEGVMLLLALLIAFNSASINMDERARDHATMFAFGVPVRTVLRMAVVENLVLGVLATAAGLAAGWFLLRLIIAIRIPSTLPDLEVNPTLSPATLVVTIALGILAVALAPLLTWRRLRRMNVPATLKVVE